MWTVVLRFFGCSRREHTAPVKIYEYFQKQKEATSDRYNSPWTYIVWFSDKSLDFSKCLKKSFLTLSVQLSDFTLIGILRKLM
jgi:hypothetical protein